ncbi:hypothetical protein ACHAP3_006853 [Botrytis cinerea]
MSNPTKILIDKFKLQRVLRERVFVKWKDESGTSCTLGSRSNRNGQDLNFFMEAYYNAEGHIHIHFTLQISIILGGKKQDIEMVLVVPPDANFADAFKPCSVSNIDDLSFDDVSAIHDAKISDSLYVICIQFDLNAKGFIVMEKKPNENIKPRTKTSAKLLLALESLSNTTIFTVYIKPNSYALVGLEQLHKRLSNAPIDTHKTSTKETYIEQVPELVEWKSLPPAYTENRVQVPRSPPIILEQKTPPPNLSEVAIAETPGRISTVPNSPTVPNYPTSSPSTSVHGIFSPNCEELSDGEIDFDNIEKDIEKDIGIDFNVDSDEEQLAKEQFAQLNPRELNKQFDHNLEASQILSSRLARWLEAALLVNLDINNHTHLTTKLSTLASCIRTSNTSAFDTTLCWCSALFFYDPLDSDSTNTLGLWEKRNLWLIKDIARTIAWADKLRYNAEISSSLDHFMKLGNAARTAALDPCNKSVYLRQKSLFLTYVLVESGKSGSISQENSKSVSRKSLEIDSNASKRVKM